MATKNRYKEITFTEWKRIQASAARREIGWYLRLKDVWLLFIKQKRKCAISGVSIGFGFEGKEGKTASLDRINSHLPYTIDNVQWVHKHINIMKGSYTDEYFIDWCRCVAHHHNKKDIMQLNENGNIEDGNTKRWRHNCEENNIQSQDKSRGQREKLTQALLCIPDQDVVREELCVRIGGKSLREIRRSITGKGHILTVLDYCNALSIRQLKCAVRELQGIDPQK